MRSTVPIYCPSYHRADTASTHRFLSQVTYVVGESEADAYRRIHPRVWAVPDAIQGNLPRVRNHILDQAEDTLLLLDDDISAVGRYVRGRVCHLSETETYDLIAHATALCTDLGTVFWGLNVNWDKRCYRETAPFCLTSYIGGPWQGHVGNPCRYDETIYLKEDYDMTLQVLARYRMALRLNMYHYYARQAGRGDSTTGGCSAYRTVERDLEHNELLRRKWGRKIVRFDTGNSHAATRRANARKTFDINPIIRPPIPGV